MIVNEVTQCWFCGVEWFNDFNGAVTLPAKRKCFSEWATANIHLELFMIRFSRRFPKRSNEHAKVLTIGRRIRRWKRGIWLSWQEMNKCMFIFESLHSTFPSLLSRCFWCAVHVRQNLSGALSRWRSSFSPCWTSNPHYVELSSASYSKLRFTSRPFLIWSKAKAKGGKAKG